jgi:hypothetical protein
MGPVGKIYEPYIVVNKNEDLEIYVLATLSILK